MATSVWEIDGHRVSLTHRYFSGVATLTVDDEVVFQRPSAVFDFGFAHRFDIHGTPAAVLVHTNGLTFRHELLTGEDAAQIQETNALQHWPLGVVLPVIVGCLAIAFVLAFVAAAVVGFMVSYLSHR